jgi:hypothetical protein
MANRQKRASATGPDGGRMRLGKFSDERRKGGYIAGKVDRVCILLRRPRARSYCRGGTVRRYATIAFRSAGLSLA